MAGAVTQSQRGVALILALWLSALVVVVAALVAQEARTAARQGAAEVAIAQAESLLDGAEALARGALVARARPGPGRWSTLRTETGVLAWRVLPATSRVDLNAAPIVLLEGLIESVAPGRGDLAAVIDASRTAGGGQSGVASADVDVRLQRRPRPRGQFGSVEGLMAIPGLPLEVATALLPHVTVHSGEARIDPTGASFAVLNAIPGVAEADANRFVLSREATPAAPGFGALSAGRAWLMQRSGVQAGEAHVVEVRARSRRGASVARDVVVRPSGGRVDVIHVGRLRHDVFPGALVRKLRDRAAR